MEFRFYDSPARLPVGRKHRRASKSDRISTAGRNSTVSARTSSRAQSISKVKGLRRVKGNRVHRLERRRNEWRERERGNRAIWSRDKARGTKISGRLYGIVRTRLIYIRRAISWSQIAERRGETRVELRAKSASIFIESTKGHDEANTLRTSLNADVIGQLVAISEFTFCLIE